MLSTFCAHASTLVWRPQTSNFAFTILYAHIIGKFSFLKSDFQVSFNGPRGGFVLFTVIFVGSSVSLYLYSAIWSFTISIWSRIRWFNSSFVSSRHFEITIFISKNWISFFYNDYIFIFACVIFIPGLNTYAEFWQEWACIFRFCVGKEIPWFLFNIEHIWYKWLCPNW